MKLTKRQLRKIIKEEKKRIDEQRGTPSGIFNSDYVYDLFFYDLGDFVQRKRTRRRLTPEEADAFRQAVQTAVDKLIDYYEE